MFTGIVQGVRKVSVITDIKGGRRLRIQLNDLAEIFNMVRALRLMVYV